MKKLLLVSLCFVLFCATSVFAQNRTVTGTVTAKDDGLPLPGVTVKVKGTSIGTQTGANGKFTLANVPANGVIQFSFIGYAPVEKPVGTGPINAVLETSSKTLGEVIVTGAYGQKFASGEVGYATTHVTSSELNASAPTNLLVGLQAKVSGLNVTVTGTGVDAGVKVLLRGSRSISGNNQALIVVDGTPLPSGDISSIDPNTIESTDILNGSSAGVLYGTEASNGAIIITTKKGSATGKPTVTYSNSLQAAKAAYYPKTQNQFGQYGGETIGTGYIDPVTGNTRLVPFENELYGPAYDGHTYTLGAPAGSATGPTYTATYAPRSTSPVQDFYRTGMIEQNDLSISSGNADDYFNISAQNVINNGVTPTEQSIRNSATFKAGKRYGIFKAEYSATYTNTKIHQVGSDYLPSASGGPQNVNYTLSQFPSSINIKDFADPTGTFGNPNDYYSAYSTNPYWAVYNSASNTTRNVFLGYINLTLNPTKYLDINYKLTDAQGTSENKSTKAEVDFSKYAQSDPLGGGNIASGFTTTGNIPGTVSDSYETGDGNGGYSRLQGDLLINLHPTLLKDFKTNVLLGSSFYNRHYKTMSTGSTSLLIPGLYNIAYSAGTPSASESEDTINLLAFFGNLQLGYKGWATIDASLREEQSSLLATKVNSYWYPGVNGAIVLTDAIPALKNNKYLSYFKIRGSYGVTAQISVGPYNINNVFGVTGGGFPYGSVGGLSLGTQNITPLVPERNTEIEVGAEFGFIDNMIHGTFTYYKQNNKNQTLSLTTSNSTGYSSVLTNVGEIQSSGWELGLTVSPLTKQKNKVGLDLGMTLADQESNVVSLLANVPQFQVSGNQYAVVGKPYPYLLGTDYVRDANGKVIISTTTGLPSTSTNTLNPLGRTSPEYLLGVTANVSYKFINLSAVGEYRTGFVDQFAAGSSYAFTGASAYTVQNGRQRFIYPNSVYLDASGNSIPNTSISTNDGNYKYWTGSTQTVTSIYATSGAYWKLREVNLGFNLTQFVKNTKYIKGLKLSLTGRNLVIWVPKTNYWGDPDVSAGTTNGGTVTSINSVPAQRVFGAKLDVTF